MPNDPASINPSLNPFLSRDRSRESYYGHTSRSRSALADMLGHDLGVDSNCIHFVPNTSTALAVVLGGIMAENLRLRGAGPLRRHYSPYQGVVRSMEEVLNGRWVGFHTHVAPVDVSVDNSFREPGGATASVVDGAQSLGTSLTEELVSSGTVVIAPLHKHLALAPGLGIVILDAVTGQQLPSIASFLSLTEGGCPSLDLLEQALDRMRRGKVWNKAQLLFSQDLVDWAASEGLEIVGGGGGLPMAAVKMSRGGGDANVMVRELPPSAKYFRRQGIIRYSYSSLGCKDDSWIDATDAFCRDLEGLIRCREY